MDTDVLIIGGSAAGLSAAIFAARRGLKTVVVTKDLGGQLASTLEIENYPGLSFTEGYTLAEAMAEQARHAGATIVIDEIITLSATGGEAPLFQAKGNQRVYSGRALIIALGKTPRNLGLPDEQRLHGKGIGYCAPNEIRQAAGKRVVIVGGGGTAFAAAKIGAPIAEEITIINRNHAPRAEEAVIKEVNAMANVTVIPNTVVTGLVGIDKIEAVTVQTTGQEPFKIPCDLLLIGAGFTVNPSLFKDLVETTALGQIEVNERQESSRPGIFAAGDVSSAPFNQAVISAGEGAKAGLAAFTWLTGKPAGSDWG